MKILVTGGAGFIGSHITELLIENKHDIIIIDNLSTGQKQNINERARFYKEDLSNHDKIKEIIEKEKPEIIYHLAAQIDVRKSVEDPVEDARINIINAINLLKLAKNNNIKHFIFSAILINFFSNFYILFAISFYFFFLAISPPLLCDKTIGTF